MTTIPENVTIEGVRFVRAVRAENAEKDLARTRAELNRTASTYQSELAESERCEREALEKATAIAAERDAWKNRATVAEAAMSAVLAVVDQHPDPCEAPGREYSTCGWKRAFQDVHAIVHPEPAFTLPTEAGAVVAYTDHEGGKQLWFRTRDTRRPWTDREGNTWHDAGLARDIAGDFTVLLGADQ